MNPLLTDSDCALVLASEGSVLLARLNSVRNKPELPLQWIVTGSVDEARKAIVDRPVLFCLHEFSNDADAAERETIKGWYDSLSVPVVSVLRKPEDLDGMYAMVAGASDYIGLDEITPGVLRRFALRFKNLRTTREKLRIFEAAFNHVHDAITITDAEMDLPGPRILYVNPAFCRITGFTPEEVIGKTPRILQGPKSDRDVLKRLKTELKAGRSFVGQTVNYTRDRREFIIEWTGTPIRDGFGNITHYVAVQRDITERIARDKALSEIEQRLEMAITGTNDGLWDWDIIQDHVWTSPRLLEIIAYAENNLPRNFEGLINLVHEEDRASIRAKIQIHLEAGTVMDEAFRFRAGSGDYRWVRVRGKVTQSENGVATRMSGALHDITREKLLGDQLQQSQKMDAIGQLSGGVAHDFNNLLLVIRGYSELLAESLSGNESLQSFVSEISAAADRATLITGQLLAFSRKQLIEPRNLDLNEIIRESEKMLKRLLRDDIEVEIRLEGAPHQVCLDPGQVQQILLNLAVNSRDAMPHGGKIFVQTRNVDLTSDYTDSHEHLEPGAFLCLEFSDTGEGIPKDILPHIFEPFFTTKEVGKGTGLGLSTLHGIVKQNNGHVQVYSEPFKGTTFKVYFRAAASDAVIPAETAAAPPLDVRGSETVLLVEDEEAVCKLLTSTLARAGYTVLSAGNGVEAMHVYRNSGQTIDVLVTDVLMPEMNGKDLAHHMRRLNPFLKVCYMSGYAQDVIAHLGVLEQGGVFLQKPFPPLHLLKRLKTLLAEAQG